ncbi:MAG: LPS assembly protein LptD [Pseudomonadota bacterium]
MFYNQEKEDITGSGDVTVERSTETLSAQTITLNQTQGTAQASGNVILSNADGDMFFTDELNISQDFSRAYAPYGEYYMSNNARLAGKDITYDRNDQDSLKEGFYTRCESCEEDPDRPLLWKITAQEVIHDRQQEDIIYKNAMVRLLGIPVAYSPYFQHAAPYVEQRTGVLIPEYGRRSIGGQYVNAYWYWGHTPQEDAVYSLHTTQKEGISPRVVYRRLFDHADLRINLGVNRGRRQEGDKQKREKSWRGHADVQWNWNVDENWRLKTSLRSMNDILYKSAFEPGVNPIHASTLTAERFDRDRYLSMRLNTVRDVRTDKQDQPNSLPHIFFDSGPVGSTGFYLRGSGLHLQRSDVSRNRNWGKNTYRAHTRIGQSYSSYDLPYGIIGEAHGYVDNLFYHTHGQKKSSPGGKLSEQNKSAYRITPALTGMLRQPWLSSLSNGRTVTIEPILAGHFFPGQLKENPLPNNDTASLDLDEASLFTPGLFSGIDRVERDNRISYGNRFTFDQADQHYSFFIGQSQRFSTKQQHSQGSGFVKKQSDWVTSFALQPHHQYSLRYNALIEPDGKSIRRSDTGATYNASWGSLRAGHALSKRRELYNPSKSDLTDIVARTQTGKIGATIPFADYWNWTYDLERDLEKSETKRFATSLSYIDECLDMRLSFSRVARHSVTKKQYNEFLFTIVLKTVGTLY